MNDSHKELLRQVEELLRASERRIVARYDRHDAAIDPCLAMDGTTSSSSTSSGSDISCVAEVPAPASSNPDISLVVSMDVADLANPTPARCSIESSSRDTTELRSASAPATASTTSTATVDIIPVLAATAGSDGTLDGGATSGVASTPAICSMDCRPRHPMAAPVLITSSAPTPTDYVLDTSSVHVVAVPLAMLDVFPTAPAPAVFAPAVHLQQLYNSEVFRLSFSQRITCQVYVHRPMPWPLFMGAHADGGETRPLPWPSFREIWGCESPSDAVMKPSPQCSLGNLFTSSGCIIINEMCSATELRCLDEVFQHCSSTSDCVQSVYATFVWPPCCISTLRWVIIRGIELKLFSHGLDQSLILDLVGRSDFSGVFRDASHWHEYFVTEVHMHVNVVCSVWRLLIGSVTSVPFLNLATFLGCDRFQWTNAWYISCYSLSRLHTRTTCVILLRSVMMGKLISAVVLPMIFLSNSYAALVEACSPSSVPDHSYKWLMLFSTVENKNLVYCYLSSHGYSEVVKWLFVGCYVAVCTSHYVTRGPVAGVLTTMDWYLVDFTCGCSVSILCDEWVPPPWDPGQAVSDFTKFMAMSVSWQYPSHADLEESLHDMVSKMSDSWEYMNFATGIIFSYLNGGLVCTSSMIIPHKPRSAGQGDTEFLLLQDGICSWAHSENMAYAGHAGLFHGFILLCLLDKQLPPTWLPPIAYCSITSSMSMDHDLSILAICEVWILNQQHRMPRLIAGSARVNAGSSTNQLSNEDNPSCCFLCWYHVRPALFLFLTFDRPGVFQGGGFAMIFNICYLNPDSYIDSLNYLDSTGLKILHIQWDPGSLELHDSSMTTAWGQAVFQGGRGVRVPPYTWAWAGTLRHGLGLPISNGRQDYKYRTHCSEERLSRWDHGGIGSVLLILLLL